MTGPPAVATERRSRRSPGAAGGHQRSAPGAKGHTVTVSQLLVFRPWPDPVYDPYDQSPTGHFSRAAWLPIVGPTSWVLWGLLAGQLAIVGSATWHRDELANAVGVNLRHYRRNDVLTRTLDRLCRFRLFDCHDDVFDVRLSAPPVTGRKLAQLPDHAVELQAQLFPVRHPHPRRQ